MEQDVDKTLEPLLLNLGCGFKHKLGFVNVDKFDNCKPDVVHDLEVLPYPWADNSVDLVEIKHTLEHLKDWYPAFEEMVRILKVGGELHIRVPDESNPHALAFRDHYHVFTSCSFDNIVSGVRGTTNAEFMTLGTLRLIEVGYEKVPYMRYDWMVKWCPWLLKFCANHLRGFIYEQRFYFRKVGPP